VLVIVVVGKSDGESMLMLYEDVGGGDSVIDVSDAVHGGSWSVDNGVGSADAEIIELPEILEVKVWRVLVTVVVVVVFVVIVMSSSSHSSCCSFVCTMLGSSLAAKVRLGCG
jgi:hypothetical protein